MRPARLDDFDALMDLAEKSGPGFTSLPVDEPLLRSRLVESVQSFAGDIPQLEYGKYLLMLEDAETGEVGGCSAVKPGTGVSAPFFNYRIITVAQSSLAADKRFDLDALVLTNEFVGYTEVGTLFLKPSFRGGGAGRLAAQSRYLLMAAAPERFGDMVLAELRGVVDENGDTPFWDAIGHHFFKMTFPEADLLSATTDNQFILDLMPKYPIYVDLLPPEAREVIGRCHADGVGAMKLLEWEGFRFERTVDIFDGGPLVACQRQNIRTIRESRVANVEAAQIGPEGPGKLALVCNERLSDFRSVHARVEIRGEDRIAVEPNVLESLRVTPNDKVRIWLREE